VVEGERVAGGLVKRVEFIAGFAQEHVVPKLGSAEIAIALGKSKQREPVRQRALARHVNHGAVQIEPVHLAKKIEVALRKRGIA